MQASQIELFRSGEKILASRQNEVVRPVNRMIGAQADVIDQSTDPRMGVDWFGALIDFSAPDGVNRWTYTITAVEPIKTGPGLSGYVRVGEDDPRYQVQARNVLEDGNGDSGVLGVGARVEQLEGSGAFLEAVPDDRYVRAYYELIEGGAVEYHFWGINVINAQCDRQPEANTLQMQQAT